MNLSPGVHLLCKQLGFQLLYLCIQLVPIQIHYDLKEKLKGVLEVFWKAQIKGINVKPQTA